MSTYIKADQFYYPHGVRRGGYLELVDGKFGKHIENLPEGAEVLDYSTIALRQVLLIHTSMDLVALMLWITTLKGPFIP